MADSLEFDYLNTIQDILVVNYLHLLAISFLFYDHLITLGNEVEYLWKRPKTPSSYWFFFNRYFAFFGNISVVILGFTSLQPHSCKNFSLYRQLLLVFNQVLVCILLTLRIYALYACSVRILAYLCGSAVVLAAVACWALFGQKSAPSQQLGCHIALSSDTAIHLAAAWEALFVYDTILFGLTIAKTWNGRHEHGITRISVPIIRLIFRDGSIYFAVMALANLSNILTFYLGSPFIRGGLSTFASSISVTMMSRLMLNLHQSADIGIYSTGIYTGTNVEYSQPTGTIELDTLWSNNIDHSLTIGQSFRMDDSVQLASFPERRSS